MLYISSEFECIEVCNFEFRDSPNLRMFSTLEKNKETANVLLFWPNVLPIEDEKK